LCALRGGPAVVAKLSTVVLAMEAAGGDPPTLHRLTFEFWKALVDGSQNTPYCLIFNSLRQLYAKVEDVLANLLIDELSDLPAYRAITHAVATGDGEAARDHAAQLIKRGADRLYEVLELLERMNRGGKR
jgi:DNA-binding FadR family transcriptional regulator